MCACALCVWVHALTRKGVGSYEGVGSTTIHRTTRVWRCVWARGVARSRTRATLISSCNVICRDREASVGPIRFGDGFVGTASIVGWRGADLASSLSLRFALSVCFCLWFCRLCNCELFAPWREYQFYRAPSVGRIGGADFLRLIREVESYLWVCMHWEYTPAHPGYGIFFLDYLNI